MTALKTIIRRARTLLWTAFSIIVIVMAVGVGVGRLLMPYSVHYQPELEQWLSEEFGQPVTIDSFDGEWTAFGPRLTLRGLNLLEYGDGTGDHEAEVVIESAALDIRPLSYLLAGRPLYNFRVIGADLELRRSEDGKFRLSGFGVSNRGSGGEGSALRDLARVGEVVLQDSSLEYIDEQVGIHIGLGRINGRLSLEGDELATEVRAMLFDGRSGLEYGEISVIAAILLNAEQRMDEAEWRVTGREIMLASLQGKLPENPFLPLTGWVDADAWGGWSRGGGHRVNGRVDLRDALLVNDYQNMHLERVKSRFRWRYTGGSRWNLHLADFFFDKGDASWTTPRLSVARHIDAGTGLWISADELPLGAPLQLTRDIMSVYGREWPAGLPNIADGQISEFDLVLDPEWRISMLAGRIADASVGGWERWPTVTGLQGEVQMSDGQGWVRLQGEQVRLDWPRMFRDPLEIGLSTCRVELQWGGGWHAGFEGCGAENADLAVRGDMQIHSNTGKPAIGANFAVTRAEMGRLDPYWPEAVMSENVTRWLRRGLVGGRLRLGRVQILGDMDDWPFRNGEGRFEAVAWLDDPVIDYLEGWPEVRGDQIVARFVGPRMEISGSVADTGGVAIEDVFVAIADMKAPVLEIEYAGDSDLPGLLGFLQSTPLKEQVGVDLSMFDFSGPATVSGRITVPLGQSPGELAVNGRVRIDGGRFADPERDIIIENILGELAYSERGFNGPGLRASTRGEPARLDLSADADGTEKFRADISGHFDVRDVLSDEQLRQNLRLLERITGRAEWRISLVVAPGPSGEENEVNLGIQSDLAGVTVDLPAPFGKRAGERWPFDLLYPLDDSGRPLDIVIEDRAALRFDLPGAQMAPRRVLIALGGRSAPLPPEGLMRIEGSAPAIDLDGWIDLVIDEMEHGSGMGGLDLEDSSIQAGELLFLDRLFPAVELDFGVSGSEFRAAFDATDIEGTVRFKAGDPGMNSLTAEFERLVLAEPQSAGMTMETDPKDLPALHLYARSLHYAGIELGETRIEAFPTPAGFHFEKIDAKSDALSVQASGDWSLADDGHRSDFSINMASESLGDFLNSMDISSSVEGGQTLVNFDAWWRGAPASFGLSRLNGQVEFSVVDGIITGADAGPGRLLGLVSFTALPKRLSLDFRDVFESGFAFDQANGTFSLENGVAKTDDVLLESSSASIAVSGQTDLVGRRYDQLLTIRPGVGNTLPIIGALVAGPGGAAAGLAMQGLLHDSLAEATKVSYSITGSWDEPVIEPVEVERAGG